jgi:hypothetical protein
MAVDPLVYDKLKTAVVAFIENVITSQPTVFPQPFNVIRQLDVDDTNKEYPCVTVTMAGLTEEMNAGTTEEFWWILPFNVLIEQKEAPTMHELEGVYLGWRMALMMAFRQALVTVPIEENQPPWTLQADVVPKAIFDDRLKQYQFVRSSFMIKFTIQEPRDGAAY